VDMQEGEWGTMQLIKKLTAPKEVRLVLGLLEEANHKFDFPAFKVVRRAVETYVLNYKTEIVKLIREGTESRQLLYFAISNASGDYVSSGQYHIYRGMLNPMGNGPDLLKIFNSSLEELKSMGAIDEIDVKEQKDGVRKQIKEVG
jgi:hypothetical protein